MFLLFFVELWVVLNLFGVSSALPLHTKLFHTRSQFNSLESKSLFAHGKLTAIKVLQTASGARLSDFQRSDTKEIQELKKEIADVTAMLQGRYLNLNLAFSCNYYYLFREGVEDQLSLSY